MWRLSWSLGGGGVMEPQAALRSRRRNSELGLAVSKVRV